jgi:diadenosine tetraphosphatase ApaH/serine/threonine PP2A family protein phosphatase
MQSRPERFLDSATLEAVRRFAEALRGAHADRIDRTYAIGDIHGCADLLLLLLDRIRAGHPEGSAAALIFLGDLIDRGPNSAEVIAIVRALEELMPAGAVQCLMGNHERMMIDWLTGGDELWLMNGAWETMASFGSGDGVPDIPDDVAAWLESRPTWREDDLRIYVHAGLRPGVPAHKQRDLDRLWIREGFLDVDYDFGKHVVHGHTASLMGPERRRFRTNIDTGAVYGGTLTAAVLDNNSPAPIELLQVPASP